MLAAQLANTVRLGFKSLKLHKLRAALTMLGIIFGVCSVIAMLAIGEGASYEAQEAIKKLGSKNIIVRSLKPPDDAKQQATGGGGGRGRAMADDDGLCCLSAWGMQTTSTGVQRVLPKGDIREAVRFDRSAVNCEVSGTMPSDQEVVGIGVLQGRFLS